MSSGDGHGRRGLHVHTSLAFRPCDGRSRMTRGPLRPRSRLKGVPPPSLRSIVCHANEHECADQYRRAQKKPAFAACPVAVNPARHMTATHDIDGNSGRELPDVEVLADAGGAEFRCSTKCGGARSELDLTSSGSSGREFRSPFGLAFGAVGPLGADPPSMRRGEYRDPTTIRNQLGSSIIALKSPGSGVGAHVSKTTRAGRFPPFSFNSFRD
jgi:hypothetical protein